jgi:uncharacterized protein YdhG (YjbR/CyaY superfamily)
MASVGKGRQEEREEPLAPAASIDVYLARVSEPARATLEKLRKTIRAAAPKAEEVIDPRPAMLSVEPRMEA